MRWEKAEVGRGRVDMQLEGCLVVQSHAANMNNLSITFISFWKSCIR